MKYKKYNYIIVFILMLVIGINTAYAASGVSCNELFGSKSPKFVDCYKIFCIFWIFTLFSQTNCSYMLKLK